MDGWTAAWPRVHSRLAVGLCHGRASLLRTLNSTAAQGECGPSGGPGVASRPPGQHQGQRALGLAHVTWEGPCGSNACDKLGRDEKNTVLGWPPSLTQMAKSKGHKCI